MTVITRFAPSPTGYLHIGSARTALFNWLYAKHTGGKYLLRIEDTDRERSTQVAVDALLKGLEWLGLEWDGETVYQFARADRHAQVAFDLIDKGMAYKCYCSPEELTQMREDAKAQGKPMGYNGLWRHKDPKDAPAGVKPVIRFKSPETGSTTIEDQVQGSVTVDHSQLDDMILLRADGTPTYMLSVVVDDHDMGITHIIRGDDHLNNAFRQYHIYKAMGWDVPVFAHIPLIHGADGAKLSKRHGALGVEAYEEMGFLPEALCNYLARLGWSHGDDEIFTKEQASQWFDLSGIGKSAARFDFDKLTHLNAHYIRLADNPRLVGLITPLLKAKGIEMTPEKEALLIAGMDGLKQRARTIPELADSALFYVADLPLTIDEKAQALLDEDGLKSIALVLKSLEDHKDWSEKGLENLARNLSEVHDIKLGKLAQPLRVALTGSTVSPSIFDIMQVLGRDASLERLRKFASD